MEKMGATDFLNLLIASGTTVLVRSIIGKSLHAKQSLNGKVLSVTTDGFITDIESLENKLKESFLFNQFKK
jgi:hypothetical protein